MPKDPYKNKLFKRSPYASKTPVIGRLVCVLDAELPERGLELSPFPSRAVLKNEIHELILTDEMNAVPGKKVDHITYLGFFEVLEGGILLQGDKLQINGESIGHLAGYDFTPPAQSHEPDHQNRPAPANRPRSRPLLRRSGHFHIYSKPIVGAHGMRPSCQLITALGLSTDTYPKFTDFYELQQYITIAT